MVRYERSIKRITPIIGTVKLRDLSARHVERLIATLESNRETHATIRMVFEDLRCALRTAQKLKIVAANITDDVEAPKPLDHSGVMRSLTDDEARTLVAAAKDDELGALYTLALTTGLRRGEMLALRWSAIDFAGAMATVAAGIVTTRDDAGRLGWSVGALKTLSSRRQVALTPELVESLRSHQRRQKALYLRTGRPWQPGGFVFQGPDGEFLTPPTVQYRHRRFVTSHKLAPHRFHDLRHTAATLLLKHGESVAVVSQLLGHANASMTLNRYAHVLPDQRRLLRRA